MKTEMLLSACILAALFALAIGVTEANTYAVKVLLTGMSVALFFYHLHRGRAGTEKSGDRCGCGNAGGVVSWVNGYLRFVSRRPVEIAAQNCRWKGSQVWLLWRQNEKIHCAHSG